MIAKTRIAMAVMLSETLFSVLSILIKSEVNGCISKDMSEVKVIGGAAWMNTMKASNLLETTSILPSWSCMGLDDLIICSRSNLQQNSTSTCKFLVLCDQVIGWLYTIGKLLKNGSIEYGTWYYDLMQLISWAGKGSHSDWLSDFDSLKLTLIYAFNTAMEIALYPHSCSSQVVHPVLEGGIKT